MRNVLRERPLYNRDIPTRIVKSEWWVQEAPSVAQTVDWGGLVVFPTETVYGIAAHPRKPYAVKRIYDIKKRTIDKPLQMLISNIDMVGRFIEDVPITAARLMDMCWPGPLTMVFYTGDEDHTLGLRVPDHPVALKLIDMCGGALYGTSANMSGMPDTTDFASARALFMGKVDVIVDGGECEEGVPSTVVIAEGEKVRVLREGAYPASEIYRVAYAGAAPPS
jgi:L-threonylcarbamoyladenylate synthase